MENGFLDKVEDNAAVHVWSEKAQSEKGDSLAEGYMSELWDYTCISVTQNSLQELKIIWDHWNDETKQLFNSSYEDFPYLLDIKVDEYLFRSFVQYWNPAYSCLTFGRFDLVPTIEEYTALLRCPRIQVDKVYSRAVNVPTFVKKLMNITGMGEQWVTVRIKQKGESRCIPWKSLQELILAHPDTRKKVDVFALSIYGLVIFPKALGHVDEATSDLFDRLEKMVTPVLAILAETFRSLNACRRTVFSGNYSPLREIAATPRRDDISEEKWLAILQNLQKEDIEWRAPWLLPDEILYRCGNFDWVPLLGIWGDVGYAPLMVLRQYRSRQFIPATQGLAEFEFSYKDDGYKKNIREVTKAWDQTRRMKRLVVGPTTTPEYNEWWVRRINDSIPKSGQGDSQSIEEHLRVVPPELEIMKQDFEKRNAEL
ncbi:uncharacterized protein LOC105762884 [Gossypium raimondii]|uniref:uncharacterized protein LOC105762884 n=1 Tax=Gossypium raimondii TaxID=29730 RepID=UPI00063AB0C7|nr:uncharacterized protein LOC105762884 [Gossypium raimondii]